MNFGERAANLAPQTGFLAPSRTGARRGVDRGDPSSPACLRVAGTGTAPVLGPFLHGINKPSVRLVCFYSSVNLVLFILSAFIYFNYFYYLFFLYSFINIQFFITFYLF